MTNSCFHRLGHIPFNVAELYMFDSGYTNSTANSDIIFQGKSPLRVELFFFIFTILAQISCGSNKGYGLEVLGSGISIFLGSIGLYSCAVLAKLSTICSAYNSHGTLLSSSTMGKLSFVGSRLEIRLILLYH